MWGHCYKIIDLSKSKDTCLWMIDITLFYMKEMTTTRHQVSTLHTLEIQYLQINNIVAACTANSIVVSIIYYY